MLPNTLIYNPNDLSTGWFYLNCVSRICEVREANLIGIKAYLEFLVTLLKFTAARQKFRRLFPASLGVDGYTYNSPPFLHVSKNCKFVMIFGLLFGPRITQPWKSFKA